MVQGAEAVQSNSTLPPHSFAHAEPTQAMKFKDPVFELATLEISSNMVKGKKRDGYYHDQALMCILFFKM